MGIAFVEIEDNDMGEDDNISQLKAYIRGLQAEAESLIFEKERYDEAIKRYDEIIKMTENSTDIELLRDFAGANFLKAHIYNSYLNSVERSISSYDIVVEKFKSSSNSELLKLYFKAQKLKADLVEEEDKLEIYRDIAERFKDSRDEEQIGYYIYAQNSIALYTNSSEEVVDIYDRVLEKTRYSSSIAIEEKVSEIEDKKATILANNGDMDSAIDTFDEIMMDLMEMRKFLNDVSGCHLFEQKVTY